MYWLLLLSFVGLSLGALYYYRQFLISKLLKYALRFLVQQKLLSTFEMPKVGFMQLTNECAQITYARFGRTYNFFVPYDIPKVIQMQGVQAKAYRQQDIIDITQQAGLPYLVSADDLHAEKIEIINEDGQIKTYTGSDKPYFPAFDN